MSTSCRAASRAGVKSRDARAASAGHVERQENDLTHRPIMQTSYWGCSRSRLRIGHMEALLWPWKGDWRA